MRGAGSAAKNMHSEKPGSCGPRRWKQGEGAPVPNDGNDCDLCWTDECNCFLCRSCGATVALGYVACPHCGGGLKGLTVCEPPAPRDFLLQPDNGFQCFECGLTWTRASQGECPSCGGILIPVRID